eukprot:1086308-Rhodomonas_salina.1
MPSEASSKRELASERDSKREREEKGGKEGKREGEKGGQEREKERNKRKEERNKRGTTSDLNKHAQLIAGVASLKDRQPHQLLPSPPFLLLLLP